MIFKLTNNDLYNETKLFIKYFIYEKIAGYDEIINTKNFNSRVAVLGDKECLLCIIRIINVNVDIHIEIFNKNEIKIQFQSNKKRCNIQDNNNLITNNIIKKIYSYIEEANEQNPIKRKILNIKNF